MDQLLNITTVPISIEIVVNKARLEQTTQMPKVQVTRERGGLQIHAEPIKINIDNTKMRKSIGIKNVDSLVKDFANDGIKICYQGIAKIVENGNQMISPQKISPAQLAAKQNQRSIETVMSFLPQYGPDISWSGGTLSISYQADELNFDWNVSTRPQFEFIPGSIEFNVTRYPSVDIEYVGEPIYVPASANPNYDKSQMDIKV